MNATETVHIIDDNAETRDSMAVYFALNGYSVDQHASADAFLATPLPEVEGALRIVISDVRMPGRTGLNLLNELRDRQEPDGRPVPVILISGHASVPLAVRAMREGAVHFFEKPVDPEALLTIVRATFDALARDHSHEQSAQQRLVALTPREREVLAAFVEQGSNKGVATALSMSSRTVEVHRARIIRKSGAGSVAELVRIALDAGLVAKRTSHANY